MHKNMQKLYESIGSYLAFDPHSVSVEDFFGELANFRILFMVSIEIMVWHTYTKTSHVYSSVKHTVTKATTHTSIFFCAQFHLLFAIFGCH